MTDRAFDRDGFRQEVGVRIKLLRKPRGITQAVLAKQLGLSRTTVANMESGRQSITLDMAWRIAIVLGVTVERLTPERA